jgi:hypothetical protein
VTRNARKRMFLKKGLCYQCKGPLDFTIGGAPCCHNCRICPDAPTKKELAERAIFWRKWKDQHDVTSTAELLK